METLLLGLLVAAGIALGLVGLLYGLPQLYRVIQVWRWNRMQRVIALTYDDGPDEVTTTALLDLLEELQVPVTFYLTGFRAERCSRAVIERLRQSPHELGTHGHSHWHAWKISPWREYSDAMAAYRTMAGIVEPDASFRPPFGKISLITLIGMWLRGRRVEWWSIPTWDTEDSFEDVDTLARRVLDARQTVVLMHSHHAEPHRRAFMLAMTRALVDLAHDRGLAFVTMSCLAGSAVGGK